MTMFLDRCFALLNIRFFKPTEFKVLRTGSNNSSSELLGVNIRWATFTYTWSQRCAPSIAYVYLFLELRILYRRNDGIYLAAGVRCIFMI